MGGIEQNAFSVLLKSLQLREIKPVRFFSDVLGNEAPIDGQANLEWTQTFADGDPLHIEPATLAFRPRYTFALTQEGKARFTHESVFIIAFEITDAQAFETAWGMPDLRSAFMEQQIKRILWPLFRQHVHDGMSRLGLPPVALPWIL